MEVEEQKEEEEESALTPPRVFCILRIKHTADQTYREYRRLVVVATIRCASVALLGTSLTDEHHASPQASESRCRQPLVGGVVAKERPQRLACQLWVAAHGV